MHAYALSAGDGGRWGHTTLTAPCSEATRAGLSLTRRSRRSHNSAVGTSGGWGAAGGGPKCCIRPAASCGAAVVHPISGMGVGTDIEVLGALLGAASCSFSAMQDAAWRDLTRRTSPPATVLSSRKLVKDVWTRCSEKADPSQNHRPPSTSSNSKWRGEATRQLEKDRIGTKKLWKVR